MLDKPDRTRTEKTQIGRINFTILIVHGDKHPINEINKLK